jgi:hypothetical protein
VRRGFRRQQNKKYVFFIGAPRILLHEYEDFVDSEEEAEEDGVLDEEFDSNAEISDYPLTDPDSVGFRQEEEERERMDRLRG